MCDKTIRSLPMLAFLLVLPIAAQAQTPQPSTTLTLAGQPGEAPVSQINGKSYVEIESLARITHGSLRFQGSQIVLTLPGVASASASSSAPQPQKTPQLSQAFSGAEIEALTQVREWRAALVNAIENNYPVTDSWVARLRRSAEAKVQLAIAAATTDPDQKTAQLLQNELTNMQQMSDQFVAMHTTANYIPPDSFQHNSLDDKILACSRALATMAATKQYADEISCH